MALHITNSETERNVRALAEATGEPISKAVNRAALERLKLVRPPEDEEQTMKQIRVILKRFDRLPVLDARTADEILGYDENGLPS